VLGSLRSDEISLNVNKIYIGMRVKCAKLVCIYITTYSIVMIYFLNVHKHNTTMVQICVTFIKIFLHKYDLDCM